MSEHLRAQWRQAATFDVNDSESYLDAVDKMMPAHQKSPDRLIRQYGKRWDRVSKDLPRGLRRGPMGNCFQNATDAALNNPDLTYCEGYAVGGYFPMMHGWVVDGEGTVYDPTWQNGSSYFGIPFDTGWLRQFILRTGMYGVLAIDGVPSKPQIELLTKGIPFDAINTTGAKTAAARDTLPNLGEAQIPSGTIRAYHYTPEANADSIARSGLQESYARGDGNMGAGNEPSAGVWAATGRPASSGGMKGPGPGQAIVEFWIRPEQVSARAEYPLSGTDLVSWGRDYHHIIVRGSVPTSQIVAIHLPWHSHARYMADMLKREPERLEEWAEQYANGGFPEDYRKAYEWVAR